LKAYKHLDWGFNDMKRLVKKTLRRPATITIGWIVITLLFVTFTALLLGGLDEANLAIATFVIILIQVFALACYELYLQRKSCK